MVTDTPAPIDVYVFFVDAESIPKNLIVNVMTLGHVLTEHPEFYSFIDRLVLGVGKADNTDLLGETFRRMQDTGRQRSMMPGDILMYNEQFYACKTLGFVPLTEGDFTKSLMAKIPPEALIK